jgi:Chromo (CHRromatin Organisation MOdifier) domain
MARNKTQYLVKWKGHPIYESTWNQKKMCKVLRQSRYFKLEENSLEVGGVLANRNAV